MIFMIFMLITALLAGIISCFLAEDDEDLLFILTILFFGIAIILAVGLVAGVANSVEFKNKVIQMRLNPESFSIQSASAVNEKLAYIARWQNTIFTFYRGFDIGYLDLSKFINI